MLSMILFHKMADKDTYGWLAQISAKKAEVTLLKRGEGGLKLGICKEIPVGTEALLAKRRSCQYCASYLTTPRINRPE